MHPMDRKHVYVSAPMMLSRTGGTLICSRDFVVHCDPRGAQFSRPKERAGYEHAGWGVWQVNLWSVEGSFFFAIDPQGYASGLPFSHVWRAVCGVSGTEIIAAALKAAEVAAAGEMWLLETGSEQEDNGNV